MADENQTTEMPAATDTSPPREEHEFTESENVVFSDLAGNLTLGGWGVIVGVVVYHLVLFVHWASKGTPPYERFRFLQVWIPLMILLFAATFIRAGWAFDRVAKTQGSDVTHLMAGLKELNGFFSWLPGVWFLLFLAALLGGIAALVHAFGF